MAMPRRKYGYLEDAFSKYLNVRNTRPDIYILEKYSGRVRHVRRFSITSEYVIGTHGFLGESQPAFAVTLSWGQPGPSPTAQFESANFSIQHWVVLVYNRITFRNGGSCILYIAV